MLEFRQTNVQAGDSADTRIDDPRRLQYISKSQTGVTRETFLIRHNRPAVYLHVNRVGMGNPEEDGKRHRRVWLELQNNCALPIWVRTYGAPAGDAADAVGVMDILVKEDKFLIVSPRGEEDPDIEPMPLSNFYDVGSRSTIAPGKSLRFSLPASHFSKHWTIHIPFQFDLPEGNGPRDDNAWGGQTIMFLCYSFYDLPMTVQKSWNQTPNR